MKKRGITITQLITIAFVVIYIVWERNIQLYLNAHNMENNFETRKDLIVIVPVLVILIIMSIRQWKKRKINNGA